MDINARQIRALDFNYLNQKETYQYSVAQLERVKSCQSIMAKVGDQVKAWENYTLQFQEAILRRTNGEAGSERSELTHLRLQVVAAYRNFVKAINVVLIYEGDAEYAAVIDQMNTEIQHYKEKNSRKGSTI